MTTNTISAASVETMKFQVANVLGFKKIYSLLDIEEAMSHFDYENEAVEGVVFSYLRAELHRTAQEAAKLFAA